MKSWQFGKYIMTPFSSEGTPQLPLHSRKFQGQSLNLTVLSLNLHIRKLIIVKLESRQYIRPSNIHSFLPAATVAAVGL